ncbi:hypothetical protein GCM10008927_18300 [Amylibacter ulvae]|uniref:DNA mimic protein DMP19 C-terminal domain-containing protein n=1 Tax=Paramylibacter ulvae TaxID=1651968 RepID=A0ABQ3D2R8_9RHOB|nr:DUF4375 domain-containing protein [Amylibacter ulvae]GHA52891.1 hypothetical protein GCM10008927_18300 [Amylibacter ulvae]
MLRSLFHAPRKYPEFYMEYYNQFDFYNGRKKWLKSIRKIPVKAVHLYTIHWLHIEHNNGGFDQYFFNSTSTTVPEAIEGFTAIGMPQVAEVVATAMARMGDPFPFDKLEREPLLDQENPKVTFDDLDQKFEALADTDQLFRRLPKYVPFADKYAGY